jgi:hypothetical protein
VTTRVHDLGPALAASKAMTLIPSGLAALTACEFVIGVDPVFANIHHFPTTDGGLAYKDTAHCVYGEHQLHRPRSDRGTKVVLPTNPAYRWDSWSGARVIVHELGHVLHQRTDMSHVAEPVSDYAKTDHREAFAEAFAAWVWGERVDDQTAAMLDRLAYS